MKEKISNGQILRNALGSTKGKVMKAMLNKYRVPAKTFESAITRGGFSKELSYHMEIITFNSPLFWQNPSMFTTDGKRR